AQLRVQGAIPQGGTAPAVPQGAALQGASLPTPPAAAVTPDSFSLAIAETIDDLTARAAEIEAARLLFSKDLANGSLHLVRFDINVQPPRQNYFFYPVIWMDCSGHWGWPPTKWFDCSGLRNFQRDYQAEVTFLLPKGHDVKVVALQPEKQALTRLNSLANASDVGVAIAAAAQFATGTAEYRNRREETFAEQRAFPLIEGIIDDEKRFRFIFNPRRSTFRRGLWASFVPFVPRNTTKKLLEPGVRRVYAYLVYSAAAAAKAEERKDLLDSIPRYLQRTAKTRIGELSGWETECHNHPDIDAGKITLAAFGRFNKFGNPYRRDPMFFLGANYPPRANPGDNESGDGDLGTRCLQLPINVTAKPPAKPTDVAWTAAVDGPLVVLAPPGAAAGAFEGAKGSVFVKGTDATPGALGLLFKGEVQKHGYFQIDPLPAKPEGNQQYKVKVFVETQKYRGWSGWIDYTGPFQRPAGASATVDIDVEASR
nr:hypothetical protein [Myxococcota bacterium]